MKQKNDKIKIDFGMMNKIRICNNIKREYIYQHQQWPATATHNKLYNSTIFAL